MKKILITFLCLGMQVSLQAQQTTPQATPEPAEKPQAATVETKPESRSESKPEVKTEPVIEKKAEKPKPVVKKKQKAIKTVYVNDRLFLGVTATPASGQRAITTIKNGVAMQLLEEQKRYSKVRLEDGKEGWVRNLFISDTLPDSKQVPKLEKENQALQQTIADLKKQMLQKDQEQISPQEMFALKQKKLALQAKIDESKVNLTRNIVIAITLSFVSLALGFILGYRALAKRVKEKFNGMKVW